MSLYEEKKVAELEPVRTLQEGTTTNATVEENRNGQFHRTLTPRQVHIISLGSNIGSGIFIATGKALAQGGPGNMMVAYGIVCLCVWAFLQTLAEMTIAFPVSGNFIDYADRWVDPALAFGAGFAEWLGWVAVIGAEATFFNVLIQYWAEDSFPAWASLTSFLVACCIIFVFPNKWFGYFEYVTSVIKIFLLLIIVFASLAMTLGAGPKGEVHHGETWTELPPFKNGFSGYANTMLLALWAVGDQVFIGVIGGEAENPRYSMAHATKLVPFRVIFIYMICITFITILVPSNDPRLLGGSGVAASPFVAALNNAGIKILPDILNAGMMSGVLAIAAESVYLASRILRAMAHQKLLPEMFAKVDNRGRPRLALLITCTVAIVLTYINLSGAGTVGFTWLISITSASFFCIWLIVAVTNFRFRQAIRAQNDELFKEQYAWSSSFWPLAPTFTTLVGSMLLVSCIYVAIDPVDGSGFTAYNFFQYLIGLIIIVVFTAAYKVFMRTPWRDPRTVDLVTGRRQFSAEDLIQLDEYYKMGRWRRFRTYVQLW